MNNYHNSLTRYEVSDYISVPGLYIKNRLTPVRVIKEMIDKKLTITRVTELAWASRKPPESHYMTSEQLNGWGSCRYTKTPMTRDTLIHEDFVIPGERALTDGETFLPLDDWGWKSHSNDVARIKAGLTPQLPAYLMPKIVDESGLTELEE